MAGSGSMLEQIMEAAMRNGGLRGGGSGGRMPSGDQGGRGGLEDILGGILGGGAPGGRAARQPGGGGLGDILGGVLGGGSGGAGSRQGGGGLGDILNSVLTGGAAAGGAATQPRGGAGGGLSDILQDFAKRAGGGSAQGGGGVRVDPATPRAETRTSAPQAREPVEAPRRTPQSSGDSGQGTLMKYGGLAILAGLAYKAYANWQAEKAASGAPGAPASLPPPGDSAFNPQRASGGPEAFSDLLVTAMIAATQADGVVDAEEQKRIFGKLDEMGMSRENRDALARRLSKPVDPRDLAKGATTPEAAAQVYAASALAISVDTPAERRYLDALAAALDIDAGLKAQLERTVARG